MEWNDELRKAFKRPFPVGAIKWKAQTTSRDKTRALAVAYVDARNVMERLDRAVGPGNWSDDYEVIVASADEMVVECALIVLGVTKRDVGDSSATSGRGGNEAKAAYSDALKRAAVKFGIGRYLYALPKRWVGYDAERKQLTEIPDLPAWAHPSAQEEDPGESLPDPEEEVPLKPREPVEVPKQKPPAGKPGLYVLQFGKHKGKTLIEAGLDYAKWIVDNINPAEQKDEGRRQDRETLVAAALALLEQDAPAESDQATSDERTEVFERIVAMGAASAEAVDKALTIKGLPPLCDLTSEQAQDLIKRLREKHWKYDPASLRHFWAVAGGQGFDENAAHQELGVGGKSLEDFTGDLEAALDILRRVPF